MKVNVSEIAKNERLLEVEVEAAEVNKALDGAYRKMVKQVNIPGFRKGRAPRHILERFVGKQALLQEALDQVVPASYVEALRETEIVPVDRPSFEVVEADEGLPLKFKATVTVMPEVKLGRYTDLGIEKEEVHVSEEDVEKELKRLQESKAVLEETEGAEATAGRVVFIEYTTECDGKQFQDEPVSAPVEIGSGKSFPELEKALEGTRIGDEREVEVKLPDEYPDQDIQGKTLKLSLKVVGIKEKRLPELDEAFAQQFGGYETLQDLRDDLKNTLLELREQKASSDVQNKAVELVVSEAEVDIPDVMVERQLDRIIQEAREKAARANLTLEEAFGKDERSLREDYRESAFRSVKTELTLEAIAETEGFKAEEAEVTKTIEDMAAGVGQPPEVMRKILSAGGGLEDLERGIIRNKVIRLLTGETPTAEAQETSEMVENQEG